MKNIFKSLSVIVAVIAVAAGATQAVFSDTDSFEGNTVSTAIVNIDARNEPMGNLPKPLNVSGLVPGEWTGWARGIVYNESNSTDVKVYMYVSNVNGVACDKVNLTVYTGHAASGAASERSMLLYNGALNSFNEANKVEITGSGKVFNPSMPANRSAVIQQKAQLDSSAGNSYQNKSCTWNEVFVAESYVAP
jgi:hypothetical protein